MVLKDSISGSAWRLLMLGAHLFPFTEDCQEILLPGPYLFSFRTFSVRIPFHDLPGDVSAGFHLMACLETFNDCC